MSNQNNVKKYKRLTKEELRNCKGLENYSDEQAEEAIQTIEKLSILFYELYKKEKQTSEEKINRNHKLKYDKDEGKENIKKRNVA